MSSGLPLTDEDRAPWLARVGDAACAALHNTCLVQSPAVAFRPCVVVACSALKRAYRDQLRARVGNDVVFLLLDVEVAALRGTKRLRQHTCSWHTRTHFACCSSRGSALA